MLAEEISKTNLPDLDEQ
uniref:Uncharacterized protein n=1 Tax=Arundo donax TaxID=35708 RepID=A0A0A9HFH1_ARUDO